MPRERLPDTRRSVTHKAVIRWEEPQRSEVRDQQERGRIKFYITVGLYPDGRPGEVFLTFDQAGSGLDGWADAWSTAVSMCLQHGETLANLVEKFGHQRFDPQGMTENPEMPFASSVVDYVVRWMDSEFKADDRRRTTEDGPGKTDGGRRTTEDGPGKTDGGRQRTDRGRT